MPYFTTDEFRDAMPDMNDSAKYSDDMVALARDAVEALIEDVCGTSFIARAVTETLDGSGLTGIVLSKPFVLSVTSVSVDGVAETGYAYTSSAGLLERNITGGYSPTVWTAGRRNVAVTYQAGYTTACPADLKLAAMQATRDRVLRLRGQGPGDRQTSVTNDVGGTTTFTVADEDHPTGLPDADAVIMRYARRLNVFGFA